MDVKSVSKVSSYTHKLVVENFISKGVDVLKQSSSNGSFDTVILSNPKLSNRFKQIKHDNKINVPDVIRNVFERAGLFNGSFEGSRIIRQITHALEQ